MSSLLKTTLSKDTNEFQMLHLHPVPTWVIDAENFSILFINKAASEKYELTEEVSGFLSYFTVPGRLVFFHKASSGNHSLNGEYNFCSSGEIKTVDLYAASFQYRNKACYQVSCVDITERIAASARLEEESNRYKTYIERSADGIYCMEFSVSVRADSSMEDIIEHARKYSYISECNNSMARMYGFEKAENMLGVLSESILNFDAPANIAFFQHCISNGFKITNAISQEKDRWGNDKFFLNNAIGIIENGYLKRIWGTQHDVTEKKKNEEKLRLLANLVEQTSDILTASDINYNPITWNRAAEKIYGITAEQILGKSIRDFIDINYVNTTRDEVQSIINEKGEWTGEAYFTRPTDNKVVTLMISFKLMDDEKGDKPGILVSARDITERKESEWRLLESENRFREMADSSPVMIWMSNEENIITYTNRKWLDFTGSNIMGNHEGWTNLVHKDDLEKARAEFNNAFLLKKQVTIIYRLLNKEGKYNWVHDVSVPRFSDGKFIGYIGSVVDIEGQKQKELQLLYQAVILENVSDVIITSDLEFKVISMNPSAEFYYGITEAEVIGHVLSDILSFDFIGSSLEQVIFRLQNFGIWKGEASVINKMGEKKYFLHSVKEIRDHNNIKIGYLATGKDITEMKLAQDQMKESEEFYRTLIADSLDGMILLNKEGNISFASPSVKNVLGYEVEDILGRNAFEFVHADDLLWAAESFQKEVVENPTIKSIVVRLMNKKGDWVWCMARGHNMLNNPCIKSIVIYFHDDTLRKEASEALKESEKRFRNLIRDLQIGVFLSDRNGNIILCNKALALMSSLTEEELVGKNVYEILHHSMVDERGVYIKREYRPLAQAIRTKKPVRNFVVGVTYPLTKGKTWIMLNCAPVVDDNGEITHLVTSVMDITERKKLEQKLVSEKISHQRQLTQATLDGQEAERREIGKELHDNIGQQLTTIKLFLDLAKSTADDATNEMVSMALKGVGDVINNIRAMSRSLIPSTLQDLGLIESINEMVDSITRTQLMDIFVDHLKFDEDELPENQKLTVFRIIQEQLNNIVKHSGAKNVLISLSGNQREIIIIVKDDGQGFDAKKIKKGLGFINITNRAELFSGKKQVISSPGKGCTLKVTFPHPDLIANAPTLPISLT